MTLIQAVCYFTVFLFGSVIGSFANVCIYRIPIKEPLIKKSHCKICGHSLHWYELIPIISWIVQRGQCRTCGHKIEMQYPLIEFLNGVLYIVIVINTGATLESVLYCMLATALLVLSIIDYRTYEIPPSVNGFICGLGAIGFLCRLEHWENYIIGCFSVSLFLYMLFLLSKGKAIGGGDIKLMAAAGLLLGWKEIILAFFLGCILASLIHVGKMVMKKAGRTLALGPYLAAGIMISALWGETLINWYLNTILWQ